MKNNITVNISVQAPYQAKPWAKRKCSQPVKLEDSSKWTKCEMKFSIQIN